MKINDRQHVDYRRTEHDAWIVPYSPPLLLLWDGHINVEAIFTVDVFLYIYKYLFKGPDHASFSVSRDDSDAIDDYIRARYISTPEAVWRIFSFNITRQYPSIHRLSMHKPGLNLHQYPSNRSTVSHASTLIRYLNRPLDPIFDLMLYAMFYENFVHSPHPDDGDHAMDGVEWWDEAAILPDVPRKIVKRHSRGEKVARIQSVRPGHGEVFYICSLLFHHPARSFEALRTVNGHTYPTFQHAAQAAGLFEEANEGLLAMEDAISQYKSPAQLRFLFVMLMLEGSPAVDIWDRFADDLSLDFGGNILGAVSHTA
jgi:hypothetical protein